MKHKKTTTVIEKMKAMFRHNQFLTLAVVIVLVLGVWLVGCESSVQSPLNPNHQVTRAQLKVEVDKYLAEVNLAVMDLDKQDLFKQKLTEIGMVIVQGGTVDPIGAGVALLGILGVGAVADNRKKDSIIKTLQNSTKAS